MAYDNTNSGVLFKNDRRETDRHPEYTGNGNLNGVEFWINAWVKESKNGKKFFSFSFREKQQRGEESQETQYDDGDTPF